MTTTNTTETLVTYGTITDTQIRALRDEAGEAGDLTQVAICEIALEEGETLDAYPHLSRSERARLAAMTPRQAWQECAEIISAAEAE